MVMAMMIESTPRLVEQVVNKCVDKCIPYSVMFELTYMCNLNCRHCYVVIDNDDTELSMEEITEIINQLLDMGTFYLTFTGGEIFTREDLLDIAMYAKNKGFLLTFMTNGTLITPEKIEEIKKLKPVKFEISLYGATAKTHDYITRVKGSFELTVEAIKGLIEKGIEVLIKFSLMKSNVKEYKEMKVLSEKLGAKCKIGPGLTPKKDGSLDPLQYDLSFEEIEKYLSKEDFELSYLLEKQKKDPLYRFRCKAGLAVCSISPSGIMYPCVIMPMAVGDLRKKSFKEIWNTEPSYELKRLRNLTSADLPTCSKCDLAPFCVRCPGVVYLETGDIVGASSSACRYAQWREHSKNQKELTVMQSTGSKSAL